MAFAAGYGIDLDGVDDIGEGDDQVGGVFLRLLIRLVLELGLRERG